jgi:hypothetical protein
MEQKQLGCKTCQRNHLWAFGEGHENCEQTKVTSLAPLAGLPLKHLWCEFRPERDRGVLSSIQTLETINGRPANEVLK